MSARSLPYMLLACGNLLYGADPVVTLDTPRTFPEVNQRSDWKKRAVEIRTQVLVSAGLWPIPEKSPLSPHIFGKIDRNGYSVEKVYFQTFPGFYLAGNLYRPLGHGAGPFPAILNPHGHWSDGRLADTKDGSIAARCISFARQGWVAFSYDMVGFNDTFFPDQPIVSPDKYYTRHRDFATNDLNQLWNINLLGLQTYDSIRALDFLASLPEVDSHRLACTGESGGGTQTYLLGAIDDRLAAQVPVVMVSHTMQGGCGCENAPGLRIKYSNMEIAAAAVPRPQFLVAATGDWTRTTLTVEGPAIKHIYELFNAADAFQFVRFDYNHNYNRTSREAVYSWLGHRFLPKLNDVAFKEQPYQKEPDANLRVFPDGKLPADALTRDQLVDSLKQSRRRQIQAAMPVDSTSLKNFRTLMTPAWAHTLQLEWPAQPTMPKLLDQRATDGLINCRLVVASESGHELEAAYWAPQYDHLRRAPAIVVLASPKHPTEKSTDHPSATAAKWLANGMPVVEYDLEAEPGTREQFSNFYTTYNRTTLQRRVASLVALCNAARFSEAKKSGPLKVILCAEGLPALYATLAAPAADAVIADCSGLSFADETSLLAPDYFCPGFLAMGGDVTPLILAAPHPLLLHNASDAFDAGPIRAAYGEAGKSKLRIDRNRLDDEALVQWARTIKYN